MWSFLMFYKSRHLQSEHVFVCHAFHIIYSTDEYFTVCVLIKADKIVLQFPYVTVPLISVQVIKVRL